MPPADRAFIRQKIRSRKLLSSVGLHSGGIRNTTGIEPSAPAVTSDSSLHNGQSVLLLPELVRLTHTSLRVTRRIGSIPRPTCIEPSSVPPIFPGTDFISKHESPYAFHLRSRCIAHPIRPNPINGKSASHANLGSEAKSWASMVGTALGSAMAFQKSAIKQTAIAPGLAL